MIVWIWTNVTLTMFALVFARLNATAPHRLRFLVCFLAMCSWLIPWGRLGSVIPADFLLAELSSRRPSVGAIQFSGAAFEGTVAERSLASVIGTADDTLMLAILIGLLLFAWSSLRYLQLVERLRRGSVSGAHLWERAGLSVGVQKHAAAGQPELRIQREVPGALTTGLLRPTIWVHADLVRHPSLCAALVHEWRHVRNGDNVYLWIITLIEKLFWWNPLLRYLGFRTRALQELSCDEACARELPTYSHMLNRLVLTLSKHPSASASYPQASCIYRRTNFNVHRIRVLERRYTMRTRHYVGTALLSIGSLFALGWAAAQGDVNQGATPEERLAPPAFENPGASERARRASEARIGEDLGPIPSLNPETTLDEADKLYQALQVYAKLLERQFDEQQARIVALDAENESLRREIEALRSRTDERSEAP
jgi:beta-lactamase regulating signal transducer with metallopeptidase domain